MNWSRQRWVLTVALIFTGQIAAIFALHTREPLRVKIPVAALWRPTFSATNGSPSYRIEPSDPLTFAGAHPEGFSGSAWLTRPAMLAQFSNNIAPAGFLSFRRSASDLTSTNESIGLKRALPFLNLPVSPAGPRESALLVEGDLADRPLRSVTKLQTQLAAEVLGPTIVEAAAQADGFLFSARIVSSSGSRAVDLSALQIANKLRFAAAPLNRRSKSLEWGNLVFQWATAQPALTNVSTNVK